MDIKFASDLSAFDPSVPDRVCLDRENDVKAFSNKMLRAATSSVEIRRRTPFPSPPPTGQFFLNP